MRDGSPSRRLMHVLLIVTVGLFFAGIVSPLLTIEKFVFIENTFSMVSAIAQLWREGRYTLTLLLGGFSIVMPVLKFVVLYRALRASGEHRMNRYLRWIHDYGRWSMLDVFVVALMIVALKLNLLFEVQIHYGLYLFAAAILATMILTTWVVRMSERMRESP